MNLLFYIICAISCLNTVLTINVTCSNDELECIHSCCNFSDFYQVNSDKCRLIGRFSNLSLDAKFNVFNVDHRYINLLVKFWYDVNAPCSKSESSTLFLKNGESDFKDVSIYFIMVHVLHFILRHFYESGIYTIH